MPMYMFHLFRADGGSTAFEAHELADEADAAVRAAKLLDDHPSCARVSVWQGDHPILGSGPNRRPVRASAKARSRSRVRNRPRPERPSRRQDLFKTLHDSQVIETRTWESDSRHESDSRVFIIGLSRSFGGRRGRDPGFEFKQGGTAPQ